MSQAGTKQDKAEAPKLSQVFLNPMFDQVIDPVNLINGLKQQGIAYTPTDMNAVWAKSILVNDVKNCLAKTFHEKGKNIETDAEAINAVNTIFDSALLASPNGYMIACNTGAIDQNRLMQLYQMISMQQGFLPGMMGGGMPGMMNPMMMGGMFGQNMWQQPKQDGQKGQQQQQQNPMFCGPMGMPMNPMMMGGMPGMNPMMMGGMPGMNPMMGGMGMGMMGMGQQTAQPSWKIQSGTNATQA